MDSCIGSNSQFSDPDTEELLSFFKDPDPFLCDVAQVMDSCIRSQSQLLDEQTVPSLPDTQRVSEDIVSSSSSYPGMTSSPGGKKTASRRYKKKSSNHRPYKSYACDWCDRKAAFKSGQGLRFHKTLRCPRREAHLGQNFFKCYTCEKAFVTTKGLDHHRQECHPELDNFMYFMD